ncbi:Calpain-7 [Smittium culicis]|uniref:Calpain-7 n=1 Tax=Smittium culicis TaxID=133412 RepID=A0A1R1XTB0_9FUNG|nr:Calpain-7 [Smittium culicis]
MTIATGEIGKNHRETYGLASSHAYAILDICEIDSLRLLKVKNPWSQLSWKGKYSSLDTESWTEYLSQKLSYYPQQDPLKDNGVFWIDYDSVLTHFDSFHLNWNPRMFQFNDILHFEWLFKDDQVISRETYKKAISKAQEKSDFNLEDNLCVTRVLEVEIDSENYDNFSLVVEQKEASKTLYFSLTAYSDIPFNLLSIPKFNYTSDLTCRWNFENSGK